MQYVDEAGQLVTSTMDDGEIRTTDGGRLAQRQMPNDYGAQVDGHAQAEVLMTVQHKLPRCCCLQLHCIGSRVNELAVVQLFTMGFEDVQKNIDAVERVQDSPNVLEAALRYII